MSRSKSPTTNPIGSSRIQPADKIGWNSGLRTVIRIPSVGIRWNPSVGIRRNLEAGSDRPLLWISSFNKLVSGANSRGQSKPTGSFCRIPALASYRIPPEIQSDTLSDSLTWVKEPQKNDSGWEKKVSYRMSEPFFRDSVIVWNAERFEV